MIPFTLPRSSDQITLHYGENILVVVNSNVEFCLAKTQNKQNNVTLRFVNVASSKMSCASNYINNGCAVFIAYDLA